MEKYQFKKHILIFPIVLIIVLGIGIAICFLSELEFLVPYIASLALETFLIIALLIYYSIELVKTSSKLENKKAEMEANEIENKRIYAKISHDIRVPMNTVINMTGQSLDNIDNTQLVEENLTKVEFSARILLSILDDILDLSAIERMDMQVSNETFDFKSLVSELSEICGKSCSSKGLDYSCDLDGVTEESLGGDCKKVRQVLANILTNAVKYTDTGFVRFSITQFEKTNKNLKMRFVISDTGKGLDPAEFDKLNLPGLSAESENNEDLVYQKSGLGLSIAKGLTTLMNGSIVLKRNPVGGSEFIIELPFSCVPQKKLSVPKRLLELKVLVIDDDNAAATTISGAIKKYGIHCDTAIDSVNGIEKCKKAALLGRAYDVVFLGVFMRVDDGKSLFEVLRQSDFAPKKIIVMSYEGGNGYNALIEREADSLLMRPLFPSDIINTLNSSTD